SRPGVGSSAVPVMTATETMKFLAERKQVVRLATVTPESRPYVVPVWYLPVPGALLITPRAQAAWLVHLETNPWVCAVVDEEPLPQRKVVVSAPAEVLHPPGEDASWRDIYRRICLRYWGEKAVDDYLAATIHVRRALISVPVRLGT